MKLAPPQERDLARLRDAVCHHTGLRLDDDMLPRLAEVLATRMEATGVADAPSYLARLASASGEVAAIGGALTVSETYFLRDENQHRVLADLLRCRETTSMRHLRVLSAGCATGEEAYSVAITALETLASPQSWNVSVVGIDLNDPSVEHARNGSYGRWALRATPPMIQARYFRECGDRFCVVDAVKDLVRFQQHNLAHPTGDVWHPDAFDIVLLRNVLMYLTRDVARRIVGQVAQSLSPGGHMFLGHAENLRGLSDDFHLRQSHGTFYYELKSLGAARQASRRAMQERAAEVEPLPGPPEATWWQLIASASTRIASLSRESVPAPAEPRPPTLDAPDLAPALELMKQERFTDALGQLARLRSFPGSDPEALLLRAMLLVGTGALTDAEQACAQLLAIDDLDAAAHYVMAICREHAGDARGAVEHAEAASYLDPRFAMPHLHLGRIARRSGDTTIARRELTLAIALLQQEDAARILLFGGGFGREALIGLCSGELAACGGVQ